MKVRRTEPRDQSQCIALGKMEMVSEGIGYMWDYNKINEFGMRIMLDDTQGVHIVCEEDDKILGMMVFEYARQFGSVVCHEIAYFVHPESRGKGVGKMLLEYAISEIEKAGIADVMSMGTRYGMAHEELMAFYSRYGFEPFEIISLKRIKQ